MTYSINYDGPLHSTITTNTNWCDSKPMLTCTYSASSLK